MITSTLRNPAASRGVKMPRLSRRAMLWSLPPALYAVAGRRFPANAAEFTYKWANDWSPSHPIAVRSVQAAQKILAETGGRLQIRVFSNGILGGSGQMVTQ